MELAPEQIQELNDFAGLLSFMPTRVFKWVKQCNTKNLCIYTGNQFGKTDMIAVDYILRIMGMHPIEWKNIKDSDSIRTFRFASEVLPEPGGAEKGSKNTQYPASKKRLPPSLLKRDITDKNKTVTIRNLSGGPDIYVEFVAYSQGSGSQAGVQRRSVWLDESAPRSFFDEQIPRLMAADGDLVYTMTPEPGLIGWEFDELYERAGMIMRTERVCQRIYKRFGERHKMVEETGYKSDLVVVMAASDDNPIYPELAAKRGLSVDEYLKEKLRLFDADDDIMDARRYGLFRHLSGKIFKTYTPSVHFINSEKYFGEATA